MAIKVITLTLAERLLLGRLLNELAHGDADTSSHMRSIRYDLDLRGASRAVDRMAKVAEQEKADAPDWDVLMDAGQEIGSDDGELRELQQEALKTYFAKESVPSLEELHRRFGPREYTTDEVHLVKVQGWLAEKDWAKRQVAGESGRPTEISLPVGMALLDVSDRLSRAVAAALAPKAAE